LAIRSTYFRKICDTQKEAASIASIEVSFREGRESCNSLHDTDVPNTIGGWKYVIEGVDIERAVEFLKEGAKNRENVMVA
jgi:hypothetical protein